MSHRSLFAFARTTTLNIIRGAGRAGAGLVAAGALAGCGGAAPPTPVRIIVPPTRTPAAAVPVLVATAAIAPASATPAPTAQPTGQVEALPSVAETPRVSTPTATAPPVPQAGGAAVANRAAATPRPTATPRASACVNVTFDELRKKGPRPAALETLADGACVSVRFASGDETRYVWHPAGARFAPGSSMYVRWKDGLVSVFRKDGVLKTNEYYRGRQQELALLQENGKYKLPASGSFVFSLDGDSLVVGLVDTLIRAR
ncbi:MAG TPA: hypothetical protein PLL45_03555 [Thermoflexales bacterium]|nr:hypothetical protein [Thermoflexales bacterium]HRA55604.1 hypothetical protein [Thermoflexales bacterium]